MAPLPPKYLCSAQMHRKVSRLPTSGTTESFGGHSNQLMQSNRSLLETKEFVSALSNCHFSVFFQVQNFFISLHWSKKVTSSRHSSSFVICHSASPFPFLSDRKWRRKKGTQRRSSGKKQTGAVNLDTRNLEGLDNEKHPEIVLCSSLSLCIISTRRVLCLFVRHSASPSLRSRHVSV